MNYSDMNYSELPSDVLAELRALGARRTADYATPNYTRLQLWLTSSGRAILVELYPNNDGWNMWRPLEERNSKSATLDALRAYLSSG
jgi:hypothetical protein